ncbi:MAG TPA: dUTP diphosphatase [Kofleriaceae bacterium]|nr:dUTP diphosphatase [Kofleriaceae bacterium]
MTPRVPIRKLRPDAIVPRYMTEHASGVDLHAAIATPVIIAPGDAAMIATGIALAIPPGFEGQVRPRSGLASKHRVTVVNAPGTIDADYRGECMVLLINHGREPFAVEPGHRIAQLVIAPLVRAELVEVDELPASERGAGGFGSTGR